MIGSIHVTTRGLPQDGKGAVPVRFGHGENLPAIVQPGDSWRGADASSLENRPSSLTNETLFARYNLNPDEIPVFPMGVAIPNKREIIAQYLLAHEMAQKNEKLGNFSSRFKSTAIQLSDGSWTLGTNMEQARDNIFCGERSAMVSAWNHHLDNVPLESLQDESSVEAARRQQKIQWLVMGSEILADNDSGMPCSECQSWMSEQRYFTPETKIATLRRDMTTGKPYLLVRTLQQMLPMNGKQQPSLSDKALSSLPLDPSPNGAVAMAKKGVSPQQVRHLMGLAKDAFDKNEYANISGKNVGAAALLSNGIAKPSARLDWTRRWFTPPDIAAATRAFYAIPDAPYWQQFMADICNGVVTLLEWLAPKKIALWAENLFDGWFHRINTARASRVNMIAYYGEDPSEMPAISSVGLLAQPAHGGPDTLLTVVENDTIKVRTIEDYMPYIYISRSQMAANPPHP